MEITLPLNKMSVQDKLQTIEVIWDSLCEKPEEFESPSWHGDVLRDREKLPTNKHFIDWQSAKKHIKKQTS
ncbi:MAG TPA: addiction module protein [Spirochaetota bacterium]|nr:addiction module protein [Spirochaetota bacterium]